MPKIPRMIGVWLKFDDYTSVIPEAKSLAESFDTDQGLLFVSESFGIGWTIHIDCKHNHETIILKNLSKSSMVALKKLPGVKPRVPTHECLN